MYLDMGIISTLPVTFYWRISGYTIVWQVVFRGQIFLPSVTFHLVNCKGLLVPTEECQPKYQPVVDHSNSVFRRQYTPTEQLNVDESCVGTKNRTSATQYLSNKHHHHWWIKFWMLYNSVSSYCLGSFTYKGAMFHEDKAEIAECWHVHTIVVKLLLTSNCFSNMMLFVYLDERKKLGTGKWWQSTQ